MKISIIIPCYNAEQYMECCFKGLENQSIGISNLEIIFVDDASVDRTWEKICDFEKRYPQNVKAIHCEENRRQGAARNIGLGYATAKYVGFVDDDDILEPEMFAQMYEKAELFQCDMVVCGYDNRKSGTVVSEELRGWDTSKRQDAFYDVQTAEERLAFITMDSVRCIWNKIYRREMLQKNDIRFPEGYIYDDIYFYELVKQYVRHVYIVDKVYYHHIFSETSASIDESRKADMMGYLDVQIMLLQELEKRNLYKDYRESYSEMLALETIGLLKTYLLRYGKIEGNLLLEVKTKIAPYQKDFMENQLLRQRWKEQPNSIDRKLATAVGIGLTETNIHQE
ncbi:MAG: glycosyltransferase family 2 protein [Clostridiales bacterium]|nr:glycosyltransferase [Roseburia sp.]MDD7638497.1 glycosyltransferase family 2 protein [Clostridiales bacterium]